MSGYGLTESEKAELRLVFGEDNLGVSVGVAPRFNPMDWVMNEWAHGRQVMPGVDPGVTTSPETPHPTFGDGTPFPPPPIPRAAWDALVAVHGVRPRVSAAVEAASLDDDDAGDED